MNKSSIRECWQYTTDPHYLNHPNYSWSFESSSGFSQLWPGVFHITLPTHKIHNREGGRKRRTNKHGIRLAPSARREKSVTLLCILWANASMYSSETPAKPLGMLTHFFALVHPVSSKVFLGHQLPPTSVDWSVLSTGVFCPLLLTALSCRLFLGPSVPCPLLVSWEISCASPLCGFRVKTDKGILRLAPTPTEINATHRVTRIETQILKN